VECRKALPKLADFTGITKSTITTHGNDNPDDQNHHSNYDDIHNEWLQRGMPSQCDDIHIGKDEKDTMLVVKNPYHERWPIFRNVRYFLSVGDGACANLGTKCTSAQNIAVTVGTSAAARICLSLPIGSIDSFSDESTKSITIPPGLFCYRIDARHVLVGGALTDGGSVLEWLSHLLKLDNQEMNKCLEDARNLLPKRYDESLSSAVSETVMIPFLSGERSTGFRTGATGVLMGLTRATTSAHLVESALVGITLRLSAILRLLLSVIEQIQNDARDDTPIRILASGKALEENALWRQMLADAAALTVILDCSTREGTSRGVAVLLRSVLSQSEQYESDRVDDTIKATPQANSRLFWDNALQKQEQLLDALTPFF
jgi:gluconokinase